MEKDKSNVAKNTNANKGERKISFLFYTISSIEFASYFNASFFLFKIYIKIVLIR